MNPMIEQLVYETTLKDNKIRLNALKKLLEITEEKIEWFEEVFDDLMSRLESDNSYQRSIGMMLLCNLAKSDKDKKINKVLSDILQLFNDEKFITRRQTIQNIWKIAVTKNELSKKIVESLLKKYHDCVAEEHYNLIRLDIISTLHSIYLNDADSCPLSLIKDLIEIEDDIKLRKKYKACLKK